MKLYNTIGSFRLLDIKVILNDTEKIFEGAVDNAPTEIREMRYSKIEMSNPITLYVYNQ